MAINLNNREQFYHRHIGPDAQQTAEMLKAVDASSLEQLIAETIPADIRLSKSLDLPAPQSEFEFLRNFKAIAQKNKLFKSYIGMGYYGTVTPPVILRNILENPGWYTAYTPYQAEIAQGRLEALINYQTMVMDLTGMEIANASLLDEGTAAAEAMHMLHAQKVAAKKDAHVCFAANTLHPHTLDLLKTRTEPIGVKLEIGDPYTLDLTRPDLFAVFIQYPDTRGAVTNPANLIAAAKENNVHVAVASDLLALCLLTPPGEMGADVVFGSSQRFGVPMGFGGPHAAFFATKEEFKRQLPGRIIGASIAANGERAYRMALQTREQHIRREKATSNICTAQVLLSVIAGSYGVYHGPAGLKAIAERVHGLAQVLDRGLKHLGFTQLNDYYFDTLHVQVEASQQLKFYAEKHSINLRYYGDGTVGISVDETTTLEDIENLLHVFDDLPGFPCPAMSTFTAEPIELRLPAGTIRESAYMTHPVFNMHHSEHEMLRYLKHLENKDLSLAHSMISLGSCTMKLNATTEMIPVTWPEWGGLHPFSPADQTEGYQELLGNLAQWLCEVTGFAAVSLQPNSGAQGEYTGLMAIRAYHLDRGEANRTVAIIPQSAHGTNPASAVMAGMQVVVVKNTEDGHIDMADLKAKVEQHSANLSCLMVTYPSTYGVFDVEIREICQLIHDNGGLVYMDGANMNAQVGLTNPAAIGADVCHLNLHKTFCIPHGGGGPGMGPIGVVARLAPFLPGHSVVKTGGDKAITAVSAAPFGSASILTISYAYIAMMGSEGLTDATRYAILNANYMMARLAPHYPVLYKGFKGRCAHEFIIDLRQFKASIGLEVEDVAKRLMDYGFHAPTVSFPVAGTMMIEPTESEPKEELDRFCDAMIAIRHEIAEIERGEADKANNVLKHAPHTAAIALSDAWDRPYSREKAIYPLPYVKASKFWPTVSRIDGAFGDRNLICACLPMEEYMTEEAAV